MPMNKDRIEKIKAVIETLEKVRDDEMKAGGGHLIPENLFALINEWYEKLEKELGIDLEVSQG